jgi:hypothetical protein
MEKKSCGMSRSGRHSHEPTHWSYRASSACHMGAISPIWFRPTAADSSVTPFQPSASGEASHRSASAFLRNAASGISRICGKKLRAGVWAGGRRNAEVREA